MKKVFVLCIILLFILSVGIAIAEDKEDNDENINTMLIDPLDKQNVDTDSFNRKLIENGNIATINDEEDQLNRGVIKYVPPRFEKIDPVSESRNVQQPNKVNQVKGVTK